MPKWIKFFIGLLLLPFCFGAAKVLWSVIAHAGGADRVWVPMLAGGLSWLVIFLLLPKPMWIYIFGHELTHAVWTWMCGGSVKKFKATSNGGQVVVTKTNFLIALAPYFFPFYTMIVALVYLPCDFIWNWRAYQVWFHLLLGFTYAFHLTLTFHVLKTRQTDITQQGYLFSAVIIFLGNATVLLVGLPLLIGSGRLPMVFSDVFTQTATLLQRLAKIF